MNNTQVVHETITFQLDLLEAQLDEANSKLKSNRAEKEVLEENVNSMESNISKLQKDIQEKNEDIKSLHFRLEELSNSIESSSNVISEFKEGDEIESFLGSINLLHVMDNLIEGGFETKLSLPLATESDLIELGIKKGQARLIVFNIEHLNKRELSMVSTLNNDSLLDTSNINYYSSFSVAPAHQHHNLTVVEIPVTDCSLPSIEANFEDSMMNNPDNSMSMTITPIKHSTDTVDDDEDLDSVICAIFDSVANPTHVTMNNFRKLIKDIGMLDSNVLAGDIEIAFMKQLKNSSLKKNISKKGASRSVSKDRLLNLQEFTLAMEELAKKKLTDFTSDMLNAVLIEMSLNSNKQLQNNKHLLRKLADLCLIPWAQKAGLLSKKTYGTSIITTHREILFKYEVISLFDKEFKALDAVFSHYSKREKNSLASTNPNARRVLSFSELMMLTKEFSVVPKLCTQSRLIILFRAVVRAVSELPLKLRGRSETKKPKINRRSSFTSIKNTDTSSEYGIGKVNDTANKKTFGDEPADEALTFNQFNELLGHIALESFTGSSFRLPEQQILALLQWLDSSKGRDKMAKRRHSTVVRFGSRTSFK